MLFAWLMAVGIGIANACILDTANDHHEPVAHLQDAHLKSMDKQYLTADKVVCLKVCATEQSTITKFKPLDATPDAQLPPVMWLSALTVPVLDLNDRMVPASLPIGHIVPVSIRFLRLTI